MAQELFRSEFVNRIKLLKPNTGFFNQLIFYIDFCEHERLNVTVRSRSSNLPDPYESTVEMAFLDTHLDSDPS
jgi:hypothetical protein